MIWLRTAPVAVALVAAHTAIPASALAQSSVTYSLAGIETGATSTQGTFVGVDAALW